MDYKHTLNLPQTDFPMKGNLSQKEPQILKRWQEEDIYNKVQQSKQGNTPFILHDGPPYANGDIHIGHAVNKVLKDIILKSKSLAGFATPFTPGWDCHGLPIELNVEKKKGKVGVKIDAKNFRKECRNYADKQVNNQKLDFQRLGVFADWNNPYLTKDFDYEANIVRALGEMIKNNHLDKGYKPVHWCTECGSSLAEAEVEYQDKTSDAIDVAFQVAQDSILGENASVVIWTTTPWTLPANEAVSLNPDFNYSLLEKAGKHYLVATDLAEKLCETYQAKLSPKTFKGSDLEGIKLKHPIYDKHVPIILGEHVSAESGTGCVHTAPAHGQEDYQVGLKYNLPVQCPVGGNGVFLEHTEKFAGEFIFKANASVISELEKADALLHHEKITHSYPHCWRHKTPVIFRATPQWFISMTKNNLQQQALAEINNVEWLPDWGKKRIELMVQNRPDWCISRQRFWGAPIPLFVHKQTGELHPNTNEIIEKVATEINQRSIDGWFDNNNEYFGISDEYEKITDTLDVWFDSGVSFYAVLDARDNLSVPADLYLEGSDQHRGWFQSSMLSSVAVSGKAPYKQVLTHGFTVDGEGKKMSKSLGNVMSPQKVANSLGADILRLWIASTDYTGEMTVSDEILKRSSDTYRRLRNTMRFMLANMNGFDATKHLVEFDAMLDLDKWIVVQMAKLEQQVIEDYAQYNFHTIVQNLTTFATGELGGFYLDVIKDRQYTCQEDSLPRRSTQTALYYLSQTIMRLLNPILPFTTYEAWQFMDTQESIFTQTWFDLQTKINIDFSSDAIETAREMSAEIKQKIELMRRDKTIGSSLDCELEIHCDGTMFENLASFEDELRFLFITSSATLVKSDEFKIVVSPSTHQKCERCWHKREDVGNIAAHPTLCGRCVENVDGDGEIRKYC
jgi:isoleucyl-tRNA synthetase